MGRAAQGESSEALSYGDLKHKLVVPGSWSPCSAAFPPAVLANADTVCVQRRDIPPDGPRRFLSAEVQNVTTIRTPSQQLQDVLKHLHEPNPALVEHAKERAESVQNRIADRITDFAGSMQFVYLHVLWFGLWIGLGAEKYPYGLLTMIVSLAAIFLSTFVMISQNRADAKRQVIANQQWETVQLEDKQNEQLLQLSNQILALTKEVHAYTTRSNESTPGGESSTKGR